VDPASRSVEDAIALAALAHRGQQYPSPESELYIFHPLRVMLTCREPVEQIVAVLHDAVEDTDLELRDLVGNPDTVRPNDITSPTLRPIGTQDRFDVVATL
jgi:(p)ppGpp synthase/HD superfamily hydrolase